MLRWARILASVLHCWNGWHVALQMNFYVQDVHIDMKISSCSACIQKYRAHVTQDMKLNTLSRQAFRACYQHLLDGLLVESIHLYAPL